MNLSDDETKILKNRLYQIERDFLDARKKYILYGVLTDELIKRTLRFSMLDYIYRGNIRADNFFRVNTKLKDETKELRALYDLIPDYFKTPHKSVWLNPTFGETSLLVGGADADLIIDGSLIDIKTVKRMQVTEQTWSQLVGYLILSEEARKHMEFPKIKKFGVYFSRFGKLWLIDSKCVYESPRYKSLKNRMFKYWEKMVSQKKDLKVLPRV